ncbi:MAG: hypothetical protein AAF747_10960 [Planctomycetota bacterium]
MRSRCTSLCTIAASLFTTAGIAVAENEPADAAPALGGPAVVARDDANPTLVMQAYDGSIEPLDLPVEVAAIDLLRRSVGLDDRTESEIERILAERAAEVDRHFLANLEDIVKLQSAVGSGDRATITRIGMPIMQSYRDLESEDNGGPFRDRLAAALPQADREQFLAMITEYEQALEAEARTEAEAAGKRFGVIQYRIQRALSRAQADAQAAYERTLLQGAAQLDEVFEQANLSTEGEAAARKVLQDFSLERLRQGKVEPDAQPTRAEIIRVFLQLSQVLSAEDAESLRKAFRESVGQAEPSDDN